MGVKTLLARSVLVLSLSGVLCLALLGLRHVVLEDVDCVVCRRAISLVFSPADHNAPIALGRVEGSVSRQFLFGRYVGPYFVQVYGAQEARRPPALVDLSCSTPVAWTSTIAEEGRNEAVSALGRGFILGEIRLTPEHLRRGRRIECEFVLRDADGLLLAVSRKAEL